MMIHPRFDGDRPKLTRHFNEARDSGLEYQLAEFRRRGGGVTADAFS